MIACSKKSVVEETSWPKSLPQTKDQFFISIGCGNTTINWALHNNLSKYDTESNLQPRIMWKTPHITEEDLDGDRIAFIARLFPTRIQRYYFGEADTFNEEVLKKEAQFRNHNITYYIVSSNDEQAKFISTLLKCIQARVYRMKGSDFFSKYDGLYDTMGIDRCACLKGSAILYGTPSLVIDGGTAITYTALDADGKIMGGGISPGLTMRFNALYQGTGELPLVRYDDFLNKYVKKAIDEQSPIPIFSRNTEESIVATTLNEIVSNIQQIINLWLKKVGPGNSKLDDASNPDRAVVITGGSGDIIAKILEPACGGILESSSNSLQQKYTVKWENSMLHIGVTAALLSQIKKNYDTSKEKEEEDDQPEKVVLEMDHIGKRVAKYFAQPQEDGDHIYRGTVKKVSKGKDGVFFFVSYDDGDAEEVFLDELYKMIKLYEVKGEKTSKKKRVYKEDNVVKVEKAAKIRRKKYEYVKVAKEFDNGTVYTGVVQSFDGEFYRIVYDDGDSEEFDENDLESGVALYRKTRNLEEENKKTDGGEKI